MGLLVKLLLETPFLLREDIQAIVADLGQTNPLDVLAAGGKGVVCLLALTCDAVPVFLGLLFFTFYGQKQGDFLIIY